MFQDNGVSAWGSVKPHGSRQWAAVRMFVPPASARGAGAGRWGSGVAAGVILDALVTAVGAALQMAAQSSVRAVEQVGDDAPLKRRQRVALW